MTAARSRWIATRFPSLKARPIIGGMNTQNSQTVAVNRSLVGLIALGLFAIAIVLSCFGLEGSQDMWRGAALKVGLVMGALWLALPSFTRNEELGRTSLAVVVGFVVVALLIGRTRIPLNILVPSVLGFAFVVRVLRPSRPTRPPRSG